MGKVWDLLIRPQELRAVIQWKFFHDPLHVRDKEKETPSLKTCYDLLELTSRSFAMVIQELEPELRVLVVVFYLVLRGLDTVEDDMTLPIELKDKMLREFYTYLETPGWTFTESGENEADRQLLVEFDVVISEFNALDKKYRDVIQEIAKRMGNGMADYANNAAHNLYGVDTLEDFDMYCYYVAGLVGEGLTRLFISSGKENPKLTEAHDFAYSMGLFLQKTNIIRDYREDLDDKRRFWPKQIWSKYAKDLSDFTEPENLDAALNCISEMTLVTIEHAVDCLIYLSVLRDQSVFNFCSIPQVMAIATLALVYRNPAVFERNIKIRRGEACQLMMESTNLRSVCEIFLKYTREIHRKTTATDPNFLRVSAACGKIEQFIEGVFPASTKPSLEQMRREAEKAQRVAAEPEMTAEDKKELYWIYAAIGAMWIVIFAVMAFIAWLFGARFDFLFADVKRTISGIFQGGGGGAVKEGVPGRAEL